MGEFDEEAVHAGRSRAGRGGSPSPRRDAGAVASASPRSPSDRGSRPQLALDELIDESPAIDGCELGDAEERAAEARTPSSRRPPIADPDAGRGATERRRRNPGRDSPRRAD